MKLKLIGMNGRTVWVSPPTTVEELGQITPSIVVHENIHYLMSGGAGDEIFYREMTPLWTASTWDEEGNVIHYRDR